MFGILTEGRVATSAKFVNSNFVETQVHILDSGTIVFVYSD